MPSILSTQKRACLSQAAPPEPVPAPVPNWTSLPYDLIRRLAGNLLADDDIDCYMAVRGVCQDWRSATKEYSKKANDTDPTDLKPIKWVLLDLLDEDLVTLVNIDTGRFLCKRIPLLRELFFIGATTGGLIVLAEPTEPHRVAVLNPFTGSIARFKVRMPCASVEVVAVTTEPPLKVFISTRIGEIMWADQNCEHFMDFWMPYPNKLTCMTSFKGNVYATDRYGSIYLSTAAADNVAVSEQRCCSAMEISMTAINASLDTAPETSLLALMKSGRYYLVESAGDLLLVTRPSCFTLDQPIVRRVDIKRNMLEPVSSIGNLALFVSHVRCLSIDADKFPTIQGGCIYFVEPIVTRRYYGPIQLIIVHVASGGIMFDQGFGNLEGCFRPFTLVEVFADYCRSVDYSKIYEMMFGEWIYSDDDSESDESSSSELDEEE